MVGYPEKLTVEVCLARAKECEELSKTLVTQAHAMMLHQLATVWKRIAEDLRKRK